jgi:predicted P-loop ATPase
MARDDEAILGQLAAAGVPPDKPDAPRATIGRAWIADCQMGKDAEPLSNLANLMLALRDAPELRELLAYDEMECSVMVTGPVPGMREPAELPRSYPRPVTDIDASAIQELIQRAGLGRITKDMTHQAIDLRGHERAYNPVRDYLNGLEWDYKPRVGKWLSYYLGADQTPYTAAIGAMFLIALAARVFRPGCKADYMLILEGEQGLGKSTACAILGGAWFSDSLPDVTAGKDVSQHLRGKWLVEVAEMHALGKAGNAALKSFLTRQTERYRPTFGRREVVEPRQCVFIGTQNLSAYLHDETGGRRYWPVRVTSIDHAALSHDRDQLLAEAVHRYREGERWWPDGDFEAEHIRPQQEARFEGDAWEEMIREHLERVGKFNLDAARRTTMVAIARDAIGLDADRLTVPEQRRIGACLGRLGWERKRGTGGDRYWAPRSEVVH